MLNAKENRTRFKGIWIIQQRFGGNKNAIMALKICSSNGGPDCLDQSSYQEQLEKLDKT